MPEQRTGIGDKPLDAQGQFTDEFERQYVKLDPVFGREDFRSKE